MGDLGGLGDKWQAGDSCGGLIQAQGTFSTRPSRTGVQTSEEWRRFLRRTLTFIPSEVRALEGLEQRSNLDFVFRLIPQEVMWKAERKARVKARRPLCRLLCRLCRLLLHNLTNDSGLSHQVEVRRNGLMLHIFWIKHQLNLPIAWIYAWEKELMTTSFFLILSNP